MDGRSWSGHKPDFTTVIAMLVIAASELDLIELGPRPSVAYCQQQADRLDAEASRYARLLHPVEWKRP